MKRSKRRLGIESLEKRELLAQVFPYNPLEGPGTNLEAVSMQYNPGVGGTQHLGVNVRVTNPARDAGGFDVQMYWEDGSGKRTRATALKQQAQSSTPPWGPELVLGVRFRPEEVFSRPPDARALVAVVDASNSIHETSETDNVVRFDLAARTSSPVLACHPEPRKFVFLLGGWLTQYGSQSGMDKLAGEIIADRRLGNNVHVINGSGTGPAITGDARRIIDIKLREAGYSPNDRVYLVGHSLGGDAARQIAKDVSVATPGKQPAHALVTIDPISFRNFQENASLDQSSLVLHAPSSMTPSTVLNIHQRTSNPQGYTLGGNAINEQEFVGHTEIDDQKSVHDRAIEFLVAEGRGGNLSKLAEARFDHDDQADFSVFRPGEGNWYTVHSAGGSSAPIQWGLPGDVPVNGDFDGDGLTDQAIWRPSNGTWFVRQSGGGTIQMQWGSPQDIPVPGDYNGDGRTDFAVWRPVSGYFHIRYATGGDFHQQWGRVGDRPINQDFDGDGRTDLAVWRPSNGMWYIIPSLSPSSPIIRQWGLPGDIPVSADFDRDGRADIAVWRPSTGTWYVIASATQRIVTQQWGLPGDIPQPVDVDGDGHVDFAVWRPGTGTWFTRSFVTGAIQIRQWGLFGDVPAANAHVANLSQLR